MPLPVWTGQLCSILIQIAGNFKGLLRPASLFNLAEQGHDDLTGGVDHQDRHTEQSGIGDGRVDLGEEQKLDQ